MTMAAAAAVSLALAAGAEAKTAAGPCSAGPQPGGDWPAYGRDLVNSRTQHDETTIGAAEAARLVPAWTFSSAAHGDRGAFHSTPAVVDGCAFIGSADGGVFAVDADTGALVWQAHEAVDDAGLGGVFVGAPVVSDGRVILLVNRVGGPYAVAYDEHTGALLWRSDPVATYEGSYTNASPAVYDGLVFFGISAEEGNVAEQGGFALLDARSGRIVKVTETIPEADQARGYAGGSIWSSTPAIDAATGFAYAGTGNPFSKRVEHPYTNAIVKVDLRRGSRTFGEIVDHYKGNIDQFSDLLKDASQPTCDAIGEHPNLQLMLGNSAGCLQLDLDFGAAPNLFRTSDGRLLVGELQKSGVYHAASADTMDRAWTATMGLSCAACNAASTAFDGSRILGVGTPGGVLEALGADAGALQWASPLADGVHYQSISSANGVTYAVDGNSVFSAFDSATGAPLLKRPTTLDTAGDPVNFSSAGIAIANHTVYTALGSGGSGGFIVAYRPAGG